MLKRCKKLDSLATANLILDIAAIINFTALLWMLRSIIKNRNMLRGYSVVGSFLTFIAILGFEIAYYLMGNLIGFVIGWATVAFWFIAFVYTFKQRLREFKKNTGSSRERK